MFAMAAFAEAALGSNPLASFRCFSIHPFLFFDFPPFVTSMVPDGGIGLRFRRVRSPYFFYF